MGSDNKTEKATPRRRQKAREKGQVTRSRDLIAAVSAMGAIVALGFQAPGFAKAWRGFLRFLLDQATTSELHTHLGAPAYPALFGGVGLTLALAWALAVGVAVAQGGLVMAPSALAPQLSRLSPATRAKQLFSMNAVKGVLKSLLPACALMGVGVSILRRDWQTVLGLSERQSAAVMAFVLGRGFEIAWKSALILLAWAGVDYLFEWRKNEGDLRMSRQELVDEYKESEGNPAVKGRIRRLQRQLRRRRMLEDAKRASVVVTNPTQYAIAIEYTTEMGAPVVVAKGRNLLATQIKEVARWQGIPLVENVPLAHALYRAVEVGQSIPPKLYIVVAEVLAAIYRAQARAAGGQ